MSVWMLACAVAVLLMVRDRAVISLFQNDYWHYLLRTWKVITFLIAAVVMAVMAPYTGDPTWDYVDASFMSLLTFLTAPWVVGMLYLAIRGRSQWKFAYVAFCVWMFSASWSYDLYLVIRDGDYPFTWLPNIFASSILYICGGLVWNLEWRPGRGVHFGFTEPGWPQKAGQTRFVHIVWYALPFMILVSAMILPFLL